MVFTEGAKWGEELFRTIFNEEIKETEIYEDIFIDKPFRVFNIKVDDQFYESGIIVFENKTQKQPKEEDYIEDIELPIVLRIFQTKISLNELEKLGESSEIILDKGSNFPVELLINGKVIGYGELSIEKNEYKLKVKTINI